VIAMNNGEHHPQERAGALSVVSYTGEVLCRGISCPGCDHGSLACQSEAVKGRHDLVTGSWAAGSWEEDYG
jgi:hypothetical protein